MTWEMKRHRDLWYWVFELIGFLAHPLDNLRGRK